MRSRLAPLVAVAALACAATWLALASARPAPPDRERETTEAGGAPAAPEAATISPATPQAALAAHAGPAGTSPAPAPDRVVRVRILCDDPAVPPAARVHVSGMFRKGWGHGTDVEATAAAGPDGIAIADVGPILADAPWIPAFAVQVTHPDCLQAEAEVDVPGAGDFGGGSVPATFALNVDVRLSRACVLEGTVLDDAGRPLGGCPVQAIHPEDTPPEGTRIFGDLVHTGPDGRFHLAVAGSGDALVAAATRGFRPGSVPAVVSPGTKREVGAIRLERGATLAGRVRCGGVPKERTTVLATWYGTKKPGTRPAGDLRLWVEDGRVIWSQLEVHPDDDGHFRIEGLESGPYRLRVPTEDWGCALHPDAYAEVDFLTRAPNERLNVDADRSQLVIEVSDGEALVQHALVTLDGRDRIRLNSNTNGEVGVVLHSGRRHRATVEAAGFAPTSFEVTSAGPGERRRQRVTLTPSRSVAADEGQPRVADPPSERPRYTFILLDVFGPDGVRLVAPCRVSGPTGSPLTRDFEDRRPVVEVLSTERTGVGGTTWILGVPEGARITVGGSAFETVEWTLDELPAMVGWQLPKPTSVVLRAR
jgi:hypothetical protein